MTSFSISSHFVSRILRTQGFTSIPSDISEELAHELQFRLFDIIQDVQRVSRTLKRRGLSVKDVNQVLEVRRIEGIYGRSYSPCLKFHSISDLLYEADGRVVIDNILMSDQKYSLDLAPIPSSPSLLLSWLVVEGRQVKGPLAPTREVTPSSQSQEAQVVTDVTGTNVVLPVRHNLSRELNEYFLRLVVCLKSDNVQLRKAGLSSLQGDTGLHQLLPYLCHYVSQVITFTLTSMDDSQLQEFPRLPALVAILQALVKSHHLNLDNYLHFVCPSLLSIIGTQQSFRLARDDFAGFVNLFVEEGDSTDLALQCFAGQCLSSVVLKYGRQIPEVQSNVFQHLFGFLNEKSSKGTLVAVILSICLISGTSGVTTLMEKLESLGKLSPEMTELTLHWFSYFFNAEVYERFKNYFDGTVEAISSCSSDVVL
ncbi:hypothetical protein P9112_009106 [Eukaryota sp. TZLM1-RC]